MADAACLYKATLKDSKPAMSTISNAPDCPGPDTLPCPPEGLPRSPPPAAGQMKRKGAGGEVQHITFCFLVGSAKHAPSPVQSLRHECGLTSASMASASASCASRASSSLQRALPLQCQGVMDLRLEPHPFALLRHRACPAPCPCVHSHTQFRRGGVPREGSIWGMRFRPRRAQRQQGEPARDAPPFTIVCFGVARGT